jgi:uncharacterized glyoxalase superfamily protein PhnB
MGQAKAIPDGFHTLTPYLICRGVADAMAFYAKAFGAVELYRMTMPDGTTIMHAEMQFGSSRLMLSEENPAWGSKSPLSLGGTGVTIHLYVPDVDKTFAAATAAGAKAVMPPAVMFWGDRYARVTDPFGHAWSIATHVEDVPPADMPRRAAEAFAQMPGKCGPE